MGLKFYEILWEGLGGLRRCGRLVKCPPPLPRWHQTYDEIRESLGAQLSQEDYHEKGKD